ncbi:Cof-type HAD-IIB family hydrolase [Streptococcus cuniculipharyngis]|uniref:HAD family phosphatase n=1 Tax=Streptococcus cuniculipharyngis TaxID=1562651 RepID=A0A5C5SFG5_9STRE|nr:Cof-type HAD-IIB family hydrolase [Streptococcus cuniculipharyngis]TWS98691.1 HAD family phosphatase [Streptococcus cuniculipharyngis]
MEEIKLLALDLDGTLLTSQKEVTLANRLALQAVKDLGIKVVLTTGRPLKAIEHLLADLDLLKEDDYSITFNGGLVQSNTGQILAKSELSMAELEEIYQALQALDLPMDILSEGTVYSLASQTRQSLYPKVNPMLDFVEISALADLPKNAVFNKAVCVYEQAILDQEVSNLPASLADKFELFKSRDIVFEIMPKGVHKAVGLDLLTKHLGLTAAQVMAMGDEENDMTMLGWAGLGVAMANASQQVKAVAAAVTSRTNEESGVAEAIERYILKGRE